jgi:hypothetical protein
VAQRSKTAPVQAEILRAFDIPKPSRFLDSYVPTPHTQSLSRNSRSNTTGQRSHVLVWLMPQSIAVVCLSSPKVRPELAADELHDERVATLCELGPRNGTMNRPGFPGASEIPSRFMNV